MKDGDGEADRLPTTDSGGDGGCRSCILTVVDGREPNLLLLLLLLLVVVVVDESSMPEANRVEIVAASMTFGSCR